MQSLKCLMPELYRYKKTALKLTKGTIYQSNITRLLPILISVVYNFSETKNRKILACFRNILYIKR